MSEENVYKIAKGELKIKKFDSSKDKIISFILKCDINELVTLNIFDEVLLKENLPKEKLNSLIESDKLTFYYLEKNEKIIGLYCLCSLKETNSISFIISKDERNKGYGKSGLFLLLKELSTSQPNIEEYFFTIKKDNIYASLIVYGNNASLVKETENDYVLKIEKNNNIWLHKVKNDDLPKVMKITKSAKELLKKNGSLQWQCGYPNEETFTNDIKNGNLYGLFEGDELMGYGAYIYGKDPNYVNIDGKWDIPANDRDMAIHRVAVDENCHGKKYGKKILEYGIKYAKKLGCVTVKVDTHKKNIPMQKTIEKSGFIYKGVVVILTEKLDNLRLAYEIIL